MKEHIKILKETGLVNSCGVMEIHMKEISRTMHLLVKELIGSVMVITLLVISPMENLMVRESIMVLMENLMVSGKTIINMEK